MKIKCLCDCVLRDYYYDDVRIVTESIVNYDSKMLVKKSHKDN
ncbi:MAG: hypothetical protein WCS56_01755 [Bacilli bacterium]